MKTNRWTRRGVVMGMGLALGLAAQMSFQAFAASASEDLEKAKAAVVKATEKAVENRLTVDRTPRQSYPVLVLLPYASEVSSPGTKNPARQEASARLGEKEKFWDKSLASLQKELSRIKEELDELAKKGGAYEAILALTKERIKLERMEKAVKDILADINKDKAYIAQPPTIKSGQGENPVQFLERKREIFRKLDSLKGSLGK